jgi:hypothetical protein
MDILNGKVKPHLPRIILIKEADYTCYKNHINIRYY